MVRVPVDTREQVVHRSLLTQLSQSRCSRRHRSFWSLPGWFHASGESQACCRLAPEPRCSSSCSCSSSSSSFASCWCGYCCCFCCCCRRCSPARLSQRHSRERFAVVRLRSRGLHPRGEVAALKSTPVERVLNLLSDLHADALIGRSFIRRKTTDTTKHIGSRSLAAAARVFGGARLASAEAILLLGILSVLPTSLRELFVVRAVSSALVGRC